MIHRAPWLAGLFCIGGLWGVAMGQARLPAAGSGPVQAQLNKWFTAKQAAGNVGDQYDNRDRGHSELDLRQHPQITKITYTEAEKAKNADWAAAGTVRPGVVFGNSSTSSPATQGGSNARLYYSDPRNVAFLHQQYIKNNLFVYPEHQDYDPGHGKPGEGYGDLFPINSPYLIVSQGSSGSDRVFLQAIAHTLAAFRPEVKKRLAESGYLMPTMQMILRMSSRALANEKEYLTGKAHPTAFLGADLNEMAMIQLANRIRLEDIPPIAQIKVVQEDLSAPGRDYFETDVNERLADTPCVIARCRRGTTFAKYLRVSVDGRDLNQRKLTYHWTILRGDPRLVGVRSLTPDGTLVDIAVGHHERMPIAPGSPLESNRVDIAVFAHNGAYFSPPSFVTVLFLDSEARVYDANRRIVEIAHGAGEVDLEPKDWSRFLAALSSEETSPGLEALRRKFTEGERAILGRVGAEYSKLAAEVERTTEAAKTAPPAGQETARIAMTDAKQKANAALTAPRGGLAKAARPLVEDRLTAMVRSRTFYWDHAAEIVSALEANPAGNAVIAGARRRLDKVRMLEPGETIKLSLELRPEQLTAYQGMLMQQFNGQIIERVLLPGLVESKFRRFYVDPMLSAPKTWRDVFEYDAAGARLGWVRDDGDRQLHFNADGLLVLSQDARQRPSRLRVMKYERDPIKTAQDRVLPRPLRMELGDFIIHYRYLGSADRRGIPHRVERVGGAESSRGER